MIQLESTSFPFSLVPQIMIEKSSSEVNDASYASDQRGGGGSDWNFGFCHGFCYWIKSFTLISIYLLARFITSIWLKTKIIISRDDFDRSIFYSLLSVEL